MVVIRFDEQHCKFLWFGSDPRRFSWVICMGQTYSWSQPIGTSNLIAHTSVETWKERWMSSRSILMTLERLHVWRQHVYNGTLFFKWTSPLHFCDHKFALDPCSWGLLSLCHDVDFIICCLRPDVVLACSTGTRANKWICAYGTQKEVEDLIILHDSQLWGEDVGMGRFKKIKIPCLVLSLGMHFHWTILYHDVLGECLQSSCYTWVFWTWLQDARLSFQPHKWILWMTCEHPLNLKGE